MSHLLWYDGEQDPIEDKIRRAAAHYRSKHGQVPTLAVLPAGTEHPKSVDGITIETAGNCLTNHIQIHKKGRPDGKVN